MSRLIDKERHRFGVEPICRVLQVPVRSYCARRRRPPSRRAREDERLLGRIGRVHAANYGVYGARRVWKQLRREGVQIGRCRVERLMRGAGLHGIQRGRRWKTTIPDLQAERPADLVERRFVAERPNELWVADLTYVRSFEGFSYLTFVLDVYSRMVVGWQLRT